MSWGTRFACNTRTVSHLIPTTFNPANGWTFSLPLGTGSCGDPPGSCRGSQAQGTCPELVAGSPRAMTARWGHSSSYSGLPGRRGVSTPFPGDTTDNWLYSAPRGRGASLVGDGWRGATTWLRPSLSLRAAPEFGGQG